MQTLIQKLARVLPIGCAALALVVSPIAQATIVTSVSGRTTTYTENFNGGTSFSGGAWYNAPLTNDDYLWLTALHPSASYSFFSQNALSELSLSFWYSVPGEESGKVIFADSGRITLGDTPGNAFEFVLNNPGPSDSGLGGQFDSRFTGSLNDLGAGMYTIKFSTAGHLVDGLKVDDLVITTTAVPEPASLALFGIGVSGVGIAQARRRKRGNACQGSAGLKS